jgi:cytochrome c
MRCSHELLVPVMVLAACATGLAQSRPYNVGSVPPPEEVRAFDVRVGPSGKELPPGSGTAKEGATLYAQRCAACHGANGAGGTANRLVATTPANAEHGPDHGSIAYYPYATIAWDFINRSMPANKPGSLSANEVYAVTAYLLFRNGIIQESDAMDAKSLPKVQMPNRNGFVPTVPVWPPAKKPSWY